MFRIQCERCRKPVPLENRWVGCTRIFIARLVRLGSAPWLSTSSSVVAELQCQVPHEALVRSKVKSRVPAPPAQLPSDERPWDLKFYL